MLEHFVWIVILSASYDESLVCISYVKLCNVRGLLLLVA